MVQEIPQATVDLARRAGDPCQFQRLLDQYPGPLADAGSLDSSMYLVWLFSIVTFTLLFAVLLWQRVAQRTTEDTLTQMTHSLRGFRSP